MLLNLIGVARSQADAADIEILRTDPTITELAQKHEIAAVREAIVECRAGDCESAVPILVEHSSKGEVGASYVLARLYESGLGVSRSKKEAEQLLWKNVEAGHAPSMFRLGRLKESDSLLEEAIELFKMASNAESAIAHLRLGKIAEEGTQNTSPNAKRAFHYYKKAMDAGQPLGYFQVARCYADGIGVSPNALEANRLFQKAAMAGVPAANTIMGRRLLEGEGFEENAQAGNDWLKRGADLGSSEAMVLLGQQFEKGVGVDQNLDMAGRLYSAAAKRGDVAGRYHLALLYLYGKGTNRDPIRAYVLLNDAQVLPDAKSLYEKLGLELDSEQLALAKRKIQQAQSKNSKK